VTNGEEERDDGGDPQPECRRHALIMEIGGVLLL
jgi:hypothetical protein